ncbi:hypothetical protein HPP92_002215 [Vanilla planifolia]|uniref:Uncharacterized protein n=1 Tax=Vanilla planifolia TaxID=51239 RepID=A0A835SE97_VANPL|nr:hypothetical protein HPP92_002215 [Vanilla planifolia]
MRTTAAEGFGGSPSSASSTPFRGFTGISLRRHQVASEEEVHQLDLLHSHLADYLKSLLQSPAAASDSKSLSPPPAAAATTLSLPFLHKLLDALLTCQADFKSLLLLVLSQNPSLVSRPSIDRTVSDLVDRAVKVLDLCNAVSISLQSLRHWSRHADIVASALHRPGSPSIPPQLTRAQRALSKLLLSSPSCFNASSSTSRRMCRICSATKHLYGLTSGLSATRGGDSGSAAVLGLAVHTISSLLHFTMWVMVNSFPCGEEAMPPLPPVPSAARQMPWAATMAALHDRIAEEVRKERKEVGMPVTAGMLAETVAVKRSGRKVMEKVNSGDTPEEAAEELAAATRKLEEGLGPFERKLREVFHRFVRWREEVLRCLDECRASSASPMNSR